MTPGYCFPYRRTSYAAPMPAPSYRYDDQQRHIGTVPTTYDASSHTVDCIAATQSSTRCRFGLAVLKMRRDAVDLGLLDRGQLPLLDSHHHDRVLGIVTNAWLENRQLHATLRFDRTPAGYWAEAMVATGAISSVSAGLTASRWTDEDGDEVTNDKLNNPHFSTWGHGGDPQVFTAQRWALTEVSLTTMPVDMGAVIL
jgi:phage head maturation protease